MGNLNEYYVKWDIELMAGDPIDAARQALGIMRDHESIATVFVVKDVNTDKEWVIDMETHKGEILKER